MHHLPRNITSSNFSKIFKRCLTTATVDNWKRLAAWKAVDDLILPQQHRVIGLGSGSTIEYALQRIASRQDLRSLVYVPTSFQTRRLILQNKLKLGTLEE